MERGVPAAGSARPHVVYHVAVSLDGRIDGFTPDVELFYRLAGAWNEDVTLTGADTLLAAEPLLAEEPLEKGAPRGAGEGADERSAPAPADGEPAHPAADRRALLAVVDSRGRIRDWPRVAGWPYWRGVVALCSTATPAGHLARLAAFGVETMVSGDRRVDLAAALAGLARRHEARVVRVDSGGTLAGALLRAGLVDELSVLLHPVLAGDASSRAFFRPPGGDEDTRSLNLDLRVMERLENDVLWLRYGVRR